jgi:hypothetical protein
VNTTPIKSRTSAIGSSIQRGRANTVQKTLATKVPTKQIAKNLHSHTQEGLENAMVLSDELVRLPDEHAHAKGDKLRAAESAARVAREKVREAEETLRLAKQANLAKGAVQPQTTSPVARKLGRGRAASLERSPRRQSGISTATPSPASPLKSAIHPKVVIEKRPSSRPPKPTQAVPPKPQPTLDPTSIATPKSTSKKQTKRKRSLSEQNYTPDTKHPKPVASSSRKPTRSETQKSSGQAVHFQSDNSDDSNELSDTDIANDIKELTTVVTSTKTKPTKKVTRTTAVTKKVSKAAAAGKAGRKAKASKEARS